MLNNSTVCSTLTTIRNSIVLKIFGSRKTFTIAQDKFSLKKKIALHKNAKMFFLKIKIRTSKCGMSFYPKIQCFSFDELCESKSFQQLTFVFISKKKFEN